MVLTRSLYIYIYIYIYIYNRVISQSPYTNTKPIVFLLKPEVCSTPTLDDMKLYPKNLNSS